MKKIRFICLGLALGLLYSCINNDCPPSRVIGDVLLMTNPTEYIPDDKTLTYCSEADTLVFISDGMKTIDSVMELTVFCKREDMIEGYKKSWNCANTKIYQKKYFNPDKRFSLEYELSLYSFISRVDGMPWSDTITEEDTVLYDVLDINFKDNKEGVSNNLRWATSLRSNPGLSYNLEWLQYYDTLNIGSYRFENIYSGSKIPELWACDTSNGPRFSNIPCLMLYRIGEGIIAMDLYNGWYFLKREE